MRRLLLLACSQRKRTDSDYLPAIERYDGPAFRLLRRFLCQQANHPIDVHILSARFGLIPQNYPLPLYDQRMTPSRATELHPTILAEFEHLLTPYRYDKLCIAMGQHYLRALHGYTQLIATKDLTLATGSMGKILAVMHDWLYESPPDAYPSLSATLHQAHPPTIRGVKIALTTEQVYQTARRSLSQSIGDPSCYHSWYVEIDGQRVAPKWLVSQLTHLPVSAFATDTARRVLTQLGIEVRRV